MLLPIVWSYSGFAQWNRDTNTNTVICTETRNQSNPWIFPDGKGGLVAVWQDDRSTATGVDIYYQRLDSLGNRVHAPGGIPICTLPLAQIQLHAASDGRGGIFITWNDESTYKVFVQHINADGGIDWPMSGIQVSQRQSIVAYPRIISDGNEGAIVAWTEPRFDNTSIVYVQRVEHDGTIAWRNGGVRLKISANSQGQQTIVPDGYNGAIVVWSEYDSRVWAQAIAGDGTVRWGTDGRLVGSAGGGASSPEAVSDGKHGVIIAWEDDRTGTLDINIYAQRIDYLGNALWTANGVPVCVELGSQTGAKLVVDPDANSLFAWIDERNQSEMVYVQRLNANGFKQWTLNGIAVCSNPDSKPETIAMGYDFAGGAYIAWDDRRTSIISSDIFAQRVNQSGTMYWAQDGIPVSTADRDQISLRMAVDSSARAFLVWRDRRNSIQQTDLYASMLWYTGVIPVQFSMFRAASMQDGVLLEWETETETNSFGFHVQRSVDTKQWSEIGFIASSSGIDGPKRYSFIDSNPLGSLQSYYRLRQVDLDGSVTYSSVVAIQPAEYRAPTLLAVYPNPVRASGEVQFSLPAESTVSISVFNMLGSSVSMQVDSRPFLPGIYSIPLSFAGLSPGMYIVRMETASGVSSLPLIVHR